jgi:hypothetical protein
MEPPVLVWESTPLWTSGRTVKRRAPTVGWRRLWLGSGRPFRSGPHQLLLALVVAHLLVVKGLAATLFNPVGGSVSASSALAALAAHALWL